MKRRHVDAAPFSAGAMVVVPDTPAQAATYVFSLGGFERGGESTGTFSADDLDGDGVLLGGALADSSRPRGPAASRVRGATSRHAAVSGGSAARR